MGGEDLGARPGGGKNPLPFSAGGGFTGSSGPAFYKRWVRARAAASGSPNVACARLSCSDESARSHTRAPAPRRSSSRSFTRCSPRWASPRPCSFTPSPGCAPISPKRPARACERAPDPLAARVFKRSARAHPRNPWRPCARAGVWHEPQVHDPEGPPHQRPRRAHAGRGRALCGQPPDPALKVCVQHLPLQLPAHPGPEALLGRQLRVGSCAHRGDGRCARRTLIIVIYTATPTLSGLSLA